MPRSEMFKPWTHQRILSAALFLVLLASLLSFTNSSKPELYPDTNNYLAFAEQIRTGELFETKPLWKIPSETLIRTPGFPLLLALWQTLFGTQIADLLFLHFTIGAVTLLTVPYLLRFAIPPWLALGLLAGLFSYSGRTYFTQILTEWAALNFLLIFCSLSIRFLQTPNTSLLALSGLLTAFAVLTRPALLPALLLPAALTFFIPHRSKRMALIALTIPLIPILSWVAFNYYRANTLTLASLSGLNLFGGASLIGDAEMTEEDPLLFRQFVDDVNRNKGPDNSATLPISTFFAPEFPLVYHHDRNIWQVGSAAYRKAVFDAMVARFGAASGADSVEDIPLNATDPEAYFPQLSAGALDQPDNRLLKTSLSVIGMNHMFARYAWRVISQEPERSAQFLLFNLLPLKWSIPWALLLLVTLSIHRPGLRCVANVTGVFLLLHVFHAVLIAAITLLVPRYSNLTLLPLCFVSLVLLSQASLEILRQASAHK